MKQMTDEFVEKLTEQVGDWKRLGWTAEHALRETERYCARNNEEFDAGGRQIVEQVFGGRFLPHTAGLLRFEPNAPAPAADEPLPVERQRTVVEPPQSDTPEDAVTMGNQRVQLEKERGDVVSRSTNEINQEAQLRAEEERTNALTEGEEPEGNLEEH